MADLVDVHPGSAQAGRVPSQTFSTDRAAETVPVRITTEDVATILLRFEGGARGAVAISQLSPGRKNSLTYEIDGSRAARGMGIGAARSALDRSSRPAQRGAAARPVAPERPGSGRGAPARWPRRGLRRHVRRMSSARSTQTSRRVRPSVTRSMRRSPTATTRCLSATRSRRAPAAAGGSTSLSRGWATAHPGGGSRMKLGFLTAPFPDTPLMDVADWAAASGFEVLEIACWPRSGGADPSLRRHEPHRRRQPLSLPGDRARRPDPRQGPHDLRAGLLPQSAAPGSRAIASRSSAISRHVIDGRREDGRAAGEHVHGRRRIKNQDQNWEEALRVWPDIVGLRHGPRPEDHPRELPDALLVRRVAGRPQHRHDAAHVAPDPRAVGRTRSV